jgi:ribose transport system permease protein
LRRREAEGAEEGIMSHSETAPAGGFNFRGFLADQLRNIAPVFTLVALVIFFGFASPTFLTLDNGMNIIRQMSITGIIAVGLTFVILTAEIDLSVAAVANAVGITVAYFTIQPDYVNIQNMPVQGWIAIILALAAALTFGLITAFGMTFIGIPSFIMTLAIMQIANGVSAVLVRGQIAYQYPDLVTILGSKVAFNIPTGVDAAGKATFIPIGWPIIVFLIFALVAHLVLTYTRFGRYVYMVGGNREAAEYSGVNVKLVLAAVMVIGTFCSGVAGMLGVAYFGSAQQNQFDAFLLDAIAAVVVGGTSLFGGRGGIGNTIIGLLVLGVVNNGLDHIQIDSFLKILIRGLILLAALVINVYAQRLKDSAE